ncbi:hypothetical protein QZH41_009778, partial [Actinostola sp. cb2023]
YKRHVCFPISNEHNDCTRDFSYNTTFISPSDQLKAKFHALQPIIDSKCSPHAEKFFCYTRIPPCGRRGDVSVNLPCRWMCNDVASKCKDVFEIRGIPIADCNILLPDGQGDEDGICRTSKFPVPFRHFRPPPTHGTDKTTCHRVHIPQCQDDLHYNFTFISRDTQNDSTVNNLQPIIASNCSSDIEKFTCFTRFPPCFGGQPGSSIQVPCKSLCLEMNTTSCNTQFKRYNIPINCDMFYPDQQSSTGLCTLRKWPAPWTTGLAPTTALPPTTGLAPTTALPPPSPTTTKPAVYKRHVCFPISNEHNDCTRDFSYNTTFISPSDQLKAKFHALQPIIDSKCSPHAEKFFCYTRIPPCGRRGDVSVNLPCRWMCNDVASKCKDVFEIRGIPIADCNILLPDGQGDEDGICRTSKFPVPFRHFRPPPTHGDGKKHGASAGLVVGIIILIIVIIAVVIGGVLYYRKRKQQQPFEPKELHNIEGKYS